MCRWGDRSFAMQAINRGRVRQRVAFNIYPKKGPFGGAQEFLKQFARELVWNGCEVVHELDPLVTHIVILEPRKIETSTFSLKQIRTFKRQYPHVKVIQRVNNCDKKYAAADYAPGAAMVDDLMLEASALADETIFISEWLRAYFVEKGFDPAVNHRVICNAANSIIFHSANQNWQNDRPLKVVTHHWSDNWLKGFKEYAELDRLISSGELEGFEFTLIGRWPESIQWKTTRTIEPLTGKELATELRQHDLYFTASRWEPGGMHFLEGMQCGMPVVYHEDGGGIVEIARLAGVGFRDNLKEALLRARSEYPALRNSLYQIMPSGDIMTAQFFKSIVDEN